MDKQGPGEVASIPPTDTVKNFELQPHRGFSLTTVHVPSLPISAMLTTTLLSIVDKSAPQFNASAISGVLILNITTKK